MSNVTIYNFVPSFREDIFVHMVTTGAKWPVNKTYCATDKTANDLVEIFSAYKPEIIQVSPTGPMGGIFQTDLVPALQITKDGKTVVILAGFLASYFMYFGPQAGYTSGIEEIEGTLKNA